MTAPHSREEEREFPPPRTHWPPQWSLTERSVPRAGTKACKLITKACKLIRGGGKVREAKRKVMSHSGHIGIKKNLEHSGLPCVPDEWEGRKTQGGAGLLASLVPEWKASVRDFSFPRMCKRREEGDDKDHSVLSLENVCGHLS